MGAIFGPFLFWYDRTPDNRGDHISGVQIWSSLYLLVKSLSVLELLKLQDLSRQLRDTGTKGRIAGQSRRTVANSMYVAVWFASKKVRSL